MAGRTARAKCRQHKSHVVSVSIAQAFVFEFGENNFKLGEHKKVIVILPPLTWPH